MTTAPALSADQLSELLGMLGDVDSVELKLTIDETTRRSTVNALDMDPLNAQIRQVMFFDTPDLRLSDAGVVLRARRIQKRAGDTVVKLRPIVPSEIAPELRKSGDFKVEVDAMPGGFVCSGSMKGEASDEKLKAVWRGDLPLSKLFGKKQRELYAAQAPEGIALDDLVNLGPITIMKLKFSAADYPRPMVAELWFYPDGSQIIELSAKCTPAEAFQAAAETKVFLSSHGVDMTAPQQTKTRNAMVFFASELT